MCKLERFYFFQGPWDNVSWPVEGEPVEGPARGKGAGDMGQCVYLYFSTACS